MSQVITTKQRRHGDIFLKDIDLDKIAINTLSHRLLEKLLTENPKLEEIMRIKKNVGLLIPVSSAQKAPDIPHFNQH